MRVRKKNGILHCRYTSDQLERKEKKKLRWFFIRPFHLPSDLFLFLMFPMQNLSDQGKNVIVDVLPPFTNFLSFSHSGSSHSHSHAIFLITCVCVCVCNQETVLEVNSLHYTVCFSSKFMYVFERCQCIVTYIWMVNWDVKRHSSWLMWQSGKIHMAKYDWNKK